MASGAHAIRVAVRDREARVICMRELRGRPSRSRVASRGTSCRREERRLRRVPGICRVVVIGLVAADAGERQSRVVVVHVT